MFFPAKGDYIIQNMLQSSLFLDQLGCQYVSRTELDPSSTEFLAATAGAGSVEVSLNRQSLKDPINVTFTILFFFSKCKGKSCQGF